MTVHKQARHCGRFFFAVSEGEVRVKTPKYIFVTGGVVSSSLGKGIASASIGLLLKSRGLRVTIQKFDPYI